MATAAALLKGGANLLLWDDSPAAREKAEAAGYACGDLTRQGVLEGLVARITSACFANSSMILSAWNVC